MEPAPSAVGPSDKHAQNKRRLARQVEEIHTIVAQLDPPCASGSSIAAWEQPAGGTQGVDWAGLPAALQPAMGASSKHATRARRKQLQVDSFVLVLEALLRRIRDVQQERAEPVTLVDFGCGTGNLLLPLAHRLPDCRFVGVDMKPEALRLMRDRAQEAGLANATTWQGMIEEYDQPFDVALALHACGNATDATLQLAVAAGAAFVVSPCCVGKLKFSLTGGSSFAPAPLTWTPQKPGDNPAARVALHIAAKAAATAAAAASSAASGADAAAQVQAASSATAAEGAPGGSRGVRRLPPLHHPRSLWLRQALPQPERHFKLLARVADTCHAPNESPDLTAALQARAGAAEACKRAVELDRCQAAREEGYAAGLFKVLGAEEMPKNDVLLGLPALSASDRQLWGPCLQLLNGPLPTGGRQ